MRLNAFARFSQNSLMLPMWRFKVLLSVCRMHNWLLLANMGSQAGRRLKEAVLHQEQDAENIPPKDLLFQILGTPDLTQAHIQRVEELLTDDPLLSVCEE